LVTTVSELQYELVRPHYLNIMLLLQILCKIILPSSHLSYQTFSTKKLLQKLRQQTQAPLSLCNKALKKCNNDVKEAIYFIQSNHNVKPSKYNNQEFNSRVGIHVDHNSGCMIQLNAVSDFACRGILFQSLLQNLVRSVQLNFKNNTRNDITKYLYCDEVLLEKIILNMKYNNTQLLIHEKLQQVSSVLREELTLGKSYIINCNENESLFMYVHGRNYCYESDNNIQTGTMGSITKLTNNNNVKQNIVRIGKELAMHIVTTKPKYISRNDIKKDVILEEKNKIEEKLKEILEKKADNLREKIVNGKLEKYYQKCCLLDQEHVLRDDKMRVGKLLKVNEMELKEFKCVY